MNTSAISKAVAKAGSQQRLADLIGVTQGLVSQWCNGARVATRHFAAIERETGITAQELLADEMTKDPASRRTTAVAGEAAQTAPALLSAAGQGR